MVAEVGDRGIERNSKKRKFKVKVECLKDETKRRD